jgi:manganese oxidase
MKKFTPMLVALVAAAILTLSGCSGGGGSTAADPIIPPGTQDPGTPGTQDPGTPGTPDPGTPPVTPSDADGDGVVDTLDAFPNDPAAAVDTDGDGFPDAFNPGATDLQMRATALIQDAFPNDPAASVDTDGDGKPDAWNTNAPPALIAASPLQLDDDDDNDGLPDVNDPAPLLGIADMPTGGVASPLFGATAFSQQMIRFEEFGPEPMPTAAAAVWTPLPQPQNPQNGPLPAALDAFLKQDGVSPFPTKLSNVDEPSPWKAAIEAYLGRPLIQPPAGVPAPAEGRPSGEDWAHQFWDTLYPQTFFKTAVAPARDNLGLRDSKQRHHYGDPTKLPPGAFTEFASGGLYHNVAGVPATEGTAAGIGIRFHPSMPLQQPNSIWTFDGTLPPKLLVVRQGVPLLMRNYNALPMDPTANNGFGRHTISTHEHNGHSPGESDGFANAFFFPGQYYDYRWPLQLAGFSNHSNAAGAQNPSASDPKAAIPCDAGETFKVLVDGVPTDRSCQDGRVMIPGDYRETMSTHWFHDHMLDYTSKNVYKGNATGMLYYSALDRGNEQIDDGVNLRFPSGTALSWGNRDYDVVLLVADKAWNPSDGQLWFNNAETDKGFLGDRMTVNWLYKPYFDVRARKYRFRILNGSVSRIMALALVHEVAGNGGEIPGPPNSGVSYNRVPFHMIANDGNVMEHAVPFDGRFGTKRGELPSQTIAERYDIVVDFSRHGIAPGDKLFFVNVMEHEDGKGSKSKVPLTEILAGNYNPVVQNGRWINGDPGVGKFLELRVAAMAPGQVDLSMNPADYEPGKTKMIPLTIDRTAKTVNGVPLATAKHHTYEFVHSGGGTDPVNGHAGPWFIKVDGGERNAADPQRISTIERGELEVFTIKGGRGWTHPVHIHFEEGMILSRNGKAPFEWEKWARKDMYRIGPEDDSSGEMEIAFRSRDFLGFYVQHCHNTMHEDHAMLLRWDSMGDKAELVDTPMPTWDGVFFEESFALTTAETGDGTGPDNPVP